MATEELQDLRRKLGLHGDTITNLKDNGFRNMADIRKMKTSPLFPANMDFIRLLRDRASIIDELMSYGQHSQMPSTAPNPAMPNHSQGPQDLGGLIQRRRSSIGDDFNTGESVIFEENLAQIDPSSKARDLPRPHDRVYNNTGPNDKSKPPALRITADQFVAESFRIAASLASKLPGRSVQTLQVYLRYLEYLAQQRVVYTDETVLTRKFRSSALEEDFEMDNQFHLNRISHKYFQAHAVRRAKPRYSPYPARSSPSPRYEYPKDYCINFNLERGCSRPKCHFIHKCGDCHGNHPACKCDKAKQRP